MKKLILIFMLLLCYSSENIAQTYEDVIYLKSGDTIRGMITEQIPEKSITIEIDGNSQTYQISEIAKITKEKIAKFELGQEYGGGVIFFIDKSGKHGLIAAKEDIAKRSIWGRNSNVGANSSQDGAENTKKIVNYFIGYWEGNCLTETAAYKCSEFVNGENNEYDDWYLPAIDELVKLYENKNVVPNLDYGDHGDYCSSTEYGYKDSYNVHFKYRSTGKYIFYYNKNDRDYCVRCIRKF